MPHTRPHGSRRLARAARVSIALAAVVLALSWGGSARAARTPPCAATAAQGTTTETAQSYRVTLWTITNGLPQGTINDIVQTSDGALWLATFAGLLRFDGIEFKTFDLDTLPGLPSIRITALTLDGEDGLWVATQTGSLFRFRAGAILEIVDPPRDPIEVIGLVRDNTGALWVRGSSGALRRVFDGRWSTVLPAQGIGVGYESLCLDQNGKVNCSMRGALMQFGVSGERLGTLETRAPIVSLMAGEGEEMWLGLSQGLALARDGALAPLSIEPAVTARVNAILTDGTGGLWLGSPAGVQHVVPGATQDAWIQLPAPAGVPDSFDVRSLARDREGNVWVGSASRGLARLTPQRMASIRGAEPQRSPTAMTDDGAGGAWITFERGGLGRVRADSNVVESQDSLAEGTRSLSIYSLLRDVAGRVWLGLENQVLRLEHGVLAPLRGDPARTPRTGPIVQTRDGAVWVAYTGRPQVVRIGADDEIAETIDLPGSIVTLSAAPDGSLWIGGVDQTWHRIDGRLDHFGTDAGLPRGDVRDILADPDGLVWIATYGGGLGLLSNGRMTRISRAHGLPDTSFSRILDDGRGRLWLLSNQGLIIAERKDLIAVAEGRAARLDPVVIGPEAGMPEANFGTPAGFRDTAGRLWFGTVAGAVRVDPAAFPFNRTAPIVHVEGVLADEVALLRSTSAPGGQAPALEIPAGTLRLAFEFTTFALTVPERVHFRCRLDGFDDAWVDNGTLRHASFTGLSPGPYTFRVAARNEDGIWSESPASISIVVLPSWWETSAFRVAAALLLIAAVLVFDRVRIGLIQRRARVLLEATEGRARAEERESRLREDLAHVARVATAGELATSLAHEVNQPLAAIVTNAQAGRRYLAHEVLDRVELDAILRDIAQQGQRAADVISRLREFLRKHPTERRPIDANHIVRDTLPLVRRELEDHQVELVLELMDAPPLVTADPVQIQQVVVNLINNACEAMSTISGQRRVEIRTTSQSGRVALEVRDTGPGIAANVAGQVFQPFVTTKASGMGLGLAICRSIVEAHGGSLSFAPAEGGGAVFRVDLPASSGGSVSS